MLVERKIDQEYLIGQYYDLFARRIAFTAENLGARRIWNKQREELRRIRKIEKPDLESFGALFEIIAQGGNRKTIVPKIAAVMDLYDLAVNSDSDNGSFDKEVAEAVISDPHKGGSLILTAALYARRRLWKRKQGESEFEISNELKSMLARDDGSVDEENYKEIVACADALDKHAAEGNFGLQFPTVVIESTHTDSEQRDRLADGIPSGLVFLPENKFTTEEMWEIMVGKGLPNRRTGDLEQNISPSAWGVEYDLSVDDTLPEETLRSRNKMMFLEMSPISKPDDESEHVHFDTLSYILAVRVSREIKEQCDGIDNGTIKVTKPGETKKTTVARTIEKYLSRVRFPCAKDVNTGRNFSILLVAMLEAEVNDGSWVTDEETEKHKDDLATMDISVDLNTARDEVLILKGLAHLNRSIRNILIDNTGVGRIRIRSEEEIRNMGKEFVWSILSMEDKAQLALKMLSSDPHEESGNWQTLTKTGDDALLSSVRRAVSPLQENMSDVDKEKVVSLILPDAHMHIKARCITVRRKEDPFDEDDVRVLVEEN